jgi:hypothetical protein
MWCEAKSEVRSQIAEVRSNSLASETTTLYRPVGQVEFDLIRASGFHYEIHTVGNSRHQEYWIPAADLHEFNRSIVGLIEVISEYRKQ